MEIVPDVVLYDTINLSNEIKKGDRYYSGGRVDYSWAWHDLNHDTKEILEKKLRGMIKKKIKLKQLNKIARSS